MRLRLPKPIVADETPTVEFEGPTQPIRRQAEQAGRSDRESARATEPSRPAREAGITRHRRTRLLDVIGTLARLGLAMVWVVSGVIKLLDPGQTYLAVKAYDVLPTAMIGPVADALPLVELCLGMLLLAGIGVRFTAALSAALLLVFIAAVGQAWMRGLTIECGCFGGGGEVAAGDTRYGQDLLRDVAFLALAGWLVLRPRTWASLAGTIRRAPASDAETEPPRAARPSTAAGPTKPAPAPQTATAPPSAPANSADSASHERLVQQIAQVKGVLAQTRRQLRALERAHAAQTARADRAEAARDAALAHAAAVAQKPRTTRVAIINSGKVTGIEMRTGSRAEEFSAAWPTR
ncbi:MauE/DoxX family redox-associated membrane protein [Pseudonocardia sp. CA-142604]|uniref:DoxX family protein n=1 Tax=Pseudonocardia sp. CA-142604 TaxID=3240024 RepID=UPI003D921D9B